MAASAPLEEYPIPSDQLFGNLKGLSDNGRVAYGYNSDLANTILIPVYWDNGVIHIAPELSGPGYTYINGVNASGSVLVGQSKNQAVRWDNGVITTLGFYGGDTSNLASGVNADGSIVVGQSGNNQAVKWVNNGPAQALQNLPDSVYSYAIVISDDGSVIGGNFASLALGNRAVRWVNGNIEMLPVYVDTTVSSVSDISGNGHVVIGNADGNGSIYGSGLKWTDNNPVQRLDFLPGDLASLAAAVNRDGSIVVGSSLNFSGASAVRWVGNQAPESIADVLNAQGVDTTGWLLAQAIGLNDDGSVIVGNAQRNGIVVPFIANLSTGGVTTPGDMGNSLQTVAASSDQIFAETDTQINQSMFLATNLIPQASMPNYTTLSELSSLSTSAGGPAPSAWQMYISGGFGLGQGNDFSNNDQSGTLGVKKFVTPDVAIGIGVLKARSENDLSFDGVSRLNAFGGSLVAAYAPISGFRLYGSTFAADLDLKLDRGYVNGAGLDSSRGTPDGFAYGTALQAGWALPVTDQVIVMPYTEYRWSKTRIDAYQETGGAFAANFTGQEMNNSSIRFGIKNNYLILPTLDLTGRAAFVHRLNEGNNGFVASSSGFTQALGNNPGDKNWFEAGIGANWQATSLMNFSTELSGRTGNTAEPALSLMLGASIGF